MTINGLMLRSCALFLLTFAVFSATLSAQASEALFEKAPPHVDEALREKVRFFYQAHVDGKFRQADTVVHENSKDAFFVADKKQYKSFEIMKITYKDDFTKATVAVTVDTDFVMPAMGKLPVTIPMTSFWRLENDAWWWDITPRKDEGYVTPFGVMKSGSENDASSPEYKLTHMPSLNEIASKIRVSKTEVSPRCGDAEGEEVVVTNGMSGPVKLLLRAYKTEGFEATLEKSDVEGGEEVKIKFSCGSQPELANKELSARLVIQPTNHNIPIKVTCLAADAAPGPASQ